MELVLGSHESLSPAFIVFIRCITEYATQEHVTESAQVVHLQFPTTEAASEVALNSALLIKWVFISYPELQCISIRQPDVKVAFVALLITT